MKLIFRTQDVVQFGLVRGLLEQHRIAFLVRNEFLAGGAGQLPVNECWPELWLLDEARAARAQELIEQALASDEDEPDPWCCTHCGESVDGHLAQCWQCGAAAPALGDPA